MFSDTVKHERCFIFFVEIVMKLSILNIFLGARGYAEFVLSKL